MTSFKLEEFDFASDRLPESRDQPMLNNWPVVYVLNGPGEKGRGNIYLGETHSFSSRMRQHIQNDEKREKLKTVRVVLDETFNKSVCLDLESQLIKYAAGDGSNNVLNRNIGVADPEYYNRAKYRKTFDDIFEELREAGVFQRTIPQITNSALFKLSPFKSLNEDQAAAAVDIMDGLVEDLAEDTELGNLVFVEGDPGTGKTVVAIYLMKLITDIGDGRDVGEADGEVDMDTVFSEFFLPGSREVFQGLKIALVVPQQSLRKSIQNVFDKTPGLSKNMVIDQWDVADDPDTFDLIIVDEAHRLNQLASQASGVRNSKFHEINEKLFGGEKPDASQLDWLRAKSRQVILMLDRKQTVRPADLPAEEYQELLMGGGGKEPRKYRLYTQMRSLGGNDYIQYVHDVLSPSPPAHQQEFGEYEVGLVNSPDTLVRLIREREEEHGLSRIVAGYAWRWASKKDASAYDIDLGEGVRLQWNTKLLDWVGSKESINEAGSIHTIQGYDLNYAGVIIGEDLKYDPVAQRLCIDRANYFDQPGKQNNKMRNRPTTDEMLLEYITNIYVVLMTRGIRGTFIHVVNPELRKYMRQFFPVLG
ncbi:DUF2075 domain-containing protein [Corynebacterium maris]|nr:DUF2075 domain-containing protein [Corynebacterium maris]